MPQSSCSNASASANEANEDPWGRYRANLARNSGMRHHRKQCRPTTILMQAWPLSIPPKIGSTAGVFFNVSSNPRLHADRPVGTCNRRWRQPLNQTQKLTCKAQSDMFAQCTCNAMKNCFKHNRKTHAAKLSILTLFFLSSFF